MKLLTCCILVVSAVVATRGSSGSQSREAIRVGPTAVVPHPRQFVVVREGSPLVVPNGKTFIATAVGDAAFNAAYSLAIDGEVIASSLYFGGPDLVPAIISALPPGIYAEEGETVECVVNALWAGPPSTGTGRVWGVLVSASGPQASLNLSHPIGVRDRVLLREGTPFIVPAGKLFVLTGMGSTGNYPNHSLRVNGVVEATGGTRSPHGTTIVEYPLGLVAASGSVVEVVNVPNDPRDFGSGVAIGYLSNL